jgi:KRI1-like family
LSLFTYSLLQENAQQQVSKTQQHKSVDYKKEETKKQETKKEETKKEETKKEETRKEETKKEAHNKEDNKKEKQDDKQHDKSQHTAKKQDRTLSAEDEAFLKHSLDYIPSDDEEEEVEKEVRASNKAEKRKNQKAETGGVPKKKRTADALLAKLRENRADVVSFPPPTPPLLHSSTQKVTSEQLNNMLEQDFDPAEFDKQMQAIFNNKYYAQVQTSLFLDHFSVSDVAQAETSHPFPEHGTAKRSSDPRRRSPFPNKRKFKLKKINK